MKNSIRKPPQWADRFLTWYCDPKLIEEIQGDLHELFQAQCAEGNFKKARLHYVWHVLRSFRYGVINKNRSTKTPH